MTTFKSIAYQILKEAGKPLHSKEITKRGVEIAIEKDEQEAESWINSEVKKLEVSI